MKVDTNPDKYLVHIGLEDRYELSPYQGKILSLQSVTPRKLELRFLREEQSRVTEWLTLAVSNPVRPVDAIVLSELAKWAHHEQTHPLTLGSQVCGLLWSKKAFQHLDRWAIRQGARDALAKARRDFFAAKKRGEPIQWPG